MSSIAPSGNIERVLPRETLIDRMAIGRCDNTVMPESANDRCRVKNRRRRLVLIECLLESTGCVDDRIYL